MGVRQGLRIHPNEELLRKEYEARAARDDRALAEVVAEALTKPVGQTLARWLVLGECEDSPATVSDIARRLHLARQSVQRVADVLGREGLCTYRGNPRHRRAKLLELTPAGRSALARIEAAQREWSDALGAQIGERVLRQAHAALTPVVEAVERAGAP